MKTFGNLLAFAPELWLLAGAIVTMVLARTSSGNATRVTAVVALVGAFLALATQFKQTITILDGAFLLDGFAIFLDVVLLGAALLSLLIGLGEVLPGEVAGRELPGFLLLATLGAMLAVSAAEMVSLIVGLELLAINLYLMAALARRGGDPARAGLGYLVLGVAGSAVLFYGLALIYGLSGQTHLAAAGSALASIKSTQPAVLLALSLMIGGFATKIGMVPVRWWTRSFDSGVPLRVLAFTASAGFVAGFAAFTRSTAWTFSGTKIAWPAVIAVVAAITMIGGSLLALFQASVRRLLVYATVGQAGFAMAAMVDLRRVGVSAILLFLVAVAVTNLSAFGAVIAYGRAVHSDATQDLAGMLRYAPGLAGVLGVALASMIGLPPFAGFFGKVLVLQAVVDGGFAWLAVVGVASSMLAALAYLRVLRVAYLDPPVFEVHAAPLDRALLTAIGISTAGVVLLGAFLVPLSSAAVYGQRALLH